MPLFSQLRDIIISNHCFGTHINRHIQIENLKVLDVTSQLVSLIDGNNEQYICCTVDNWAHTKLWFRSNQGTHLDSISSAVQFRTFSLVQCYTYASVFSYALQGLHSNCQVTSAKMLFLEPILLTCIRKIVIKTKTNKIDWQLKQYSQPLWLSFCLLNIFLWLSTNTSWLSGYLFIILTAQCVVWV